MRRSSLILHFERLDLLGIGFVLVILSFDHVFVLPVLVIYLYLVRKQICFLIFIIGVLIMYMAWFTLGQVNLPQAIDEDVTVVRVEHQDDYATLWLKTQKGTFLAYVSDTTLISGDVIHVKGDVSRFPYQTTPKGFDPFKYYLSLGIKGKIRVDDISYRYHRFHIFEFRDRLIEYVQHQQHHELVEVMMFGSKTYEKKDLYDGLGLSYVLSVSGLHVFVLVYMIKKIMFYLDMPMRFQTVIVILFYVIMAYLHRFDLGVTRLLMMRILVDMNRHYEWRRSRLELIHIACLMCLVIQPYALYSVAFFMVYVIILGLELCEPLYRSHHGLVRRIIMGCLILVCIIPFRSSVNLYQIIFVPILALPLIGFYMIGSFSVVLLPRLSGLFNSLVVWIEQILTYLSTNTLTIVYGKLDGLYSVLFYVILIGILLSQHRLKRGLMLIFMTSLLFLPSYDQHQQTSITFLDVGQGDSTIITSKGCTTIIDAYQGIVDYAKHQGIGVIDYLILTHSDTDHIKEAEELMTTLSVKSLYLSLSDDEYPLYQHDIKRIKQGYHMSCGSVSIDVLSPYGDERESNDGSIVLKVTTLDLSFLLTGYISVYTEERLIQSYGHHLKSDVLKVAHHGSNTSTSYSFLSYVDPDYAIISVGRSNQYGFPHQEVLNRLMNKGIIIYRTDECGSIVYSPSKKKSKWEMYLPF